MFGNIILSVLYLFIAIIYITLFHYPKKMIAKSARILVLLSIILHLSFILYLTFTEGRLALATVFEVLSMLALFMTILLISIEIKTGEKSLGAFIFPLVFCLQVISVLGKRIPVLDESITHMPLLGLHTLTTVVGYTCFIYSFILALMYLNLLKRFENKKFDSIFFGMPPLDLLDKLNMIAMNTGFFFLSFGLISGGWLSLLIWNEIPFFDPKIFLTICLWFIYFVSLIIRSLLKLRGRTMSYASIVGFILIALIIILESLTQATLHRF